MTPEERSLGLASLANYRRALYWLDGDPADLERAIQPRPKRHNCIRGVRFAVRSPPRPSRSACGSDHARCRR